MGTLGKGHLSSVESQMVLESLGDHSSANIDFVGLTLRRVLRGYELRELEPRINDIALVTCCRR
jgi:hypothetical protein